MFLFRFTVWGSPSPAPRRELRTVVCSIRSRSCLAADRARLRLRRQSPRALAWRVELAVALRPLRLEWYRCQWPGVPRIGGGAGTRRALRWRGASSRPVRGLHFPLGAWGVWSQIMDGGGPMRQRCTHHKQHETSFNQTRRLASRPTESAGVRLLDPAELRGRAQQEDLQRLQPRPKQPRPCWEPLPPSKALRVLPLPAASAMAVPRV